MNLFYENWRSDNNIVPQSDPNISDELGGALTPANYKFGGDVNRPEFGCAWDGTPINCNSISWILGCSKHPEIRVNTRAEGGWDTYYALQNSVSIREYRVYKRGDLGKDTTSKDSEDVIKVESSLTYMGSFYEVLISPIWDMMISQMQQQPFDDLAAFASAKKNCAGLLTALLAVFKRSSNIADLPIVDATSNNPAVLNMTLDELGLAPGSTMTLKEWKNPGTLTETINNKIYIYDRYFNYPDRSTPETRGAVVFHEILHVLFRGGHQDLVRELGINHTEPTIPPPPANSVFYSGPEGQVRWEQKYRSDHRQEFEQAASDSLQKWIDNDCKN